ncbi:uncharacterized protein LOC105781484 [Gossypium raimondii]|uniref:uncharacterized protein LOC105781484 n=1 Tax=Gossypium raimondii TaxID=29730 RepID=UPI00063AF047|nr:uncharacterized protein LOC105781484 [Gossypium raimondii]
MVWLQSGKTLEPKEVDIEDGLANKEKVQLQGETPTPQKLNVENSDEFKKFLDVLKKLLINIPLVEALEQMPNYVKLMKAILSKKRRLGEFEVVALTKNCNAFLQNKLPLRKKDPGCFTILYNNGESYCDKALCDLGASINLMSMSVFRKLGIGEVR